ncbi:MAG TPA: hypothetical protein VF534_06115 [Paraburkholderia sp.]
MKFSVCVAVAALTLSAGAYAQTSQTFHFGEGQNTLPSGNAHAAPAPAAQAPQAPQATQVQQPPQSQSAGQPAPLPPKAKPAHTTKHHRHHRGHVKQPDMYGHN